MKGWRMKFKDERVEDVKDERFEDEI